MRGWILIVMRSTIHRGHGKPTKSALLRDQIRQMARRMGPNAKLPTRDELCAELGASRATMDGILNILEGENIIFRRQGSGTYVSPRVNCRNILVLITASLIDEGELSPFWGMLWGKLVKEGQRRASYRNEDIHFKLVASDANQLTPLPLDVMSAIESGQLHGVLSIGMEGKQEDYQISSDIPMVSYAGWGYWHVNIDLKPATTEAVARLARAGCRRIGFWTYDSRSRDPINGSCYESDWTEWFQSALASSGLPYLPELRRLGVQSEAEICHGQTCIVRAPAASKFQDQGFEAAMRTFGTDSTMRPDGLVINDDMMTCGALVALSRLGIEPGRDVLIASHSNVGSPILYGWEDRLLLWKVDSNQIVETMFSLLDRLMTGERPEENIIDIIPRFTES